MWLELSYIRVYNIVQHCNIAGRYMLLYILAVTFALPIGSILGVWLGWLMERGCEDGLEF